MQETFEQARDREAAETVSDLEALREANEALQAFEKIPKEYVEHIIEKLKSSESYRSYEERPVNLDTIESIVNGFKRNADRHDPDAAKELKNVQILLRQVYEGIDNYQDSIAKQALVNIGYNENDSYFRRDYQAEHEAMDRHRRLVHNGLISSLTALNRHFAREFPKFGYEVDRNKLFGQRHIEDRNYIGEWAISMAKAQPIRTALKELKKLKIKNGRSAKAETAI